MGKYNFAQDLETGLNAENYVIEFLKSIGADSIEICKDKRWDISFKQGSTNHTVEVKNDLMYKQTGNVAIEYSSRGKTSGITTSLAKYWIYVLDDEIWMVYTPDLRDVLNKCSYRRVSGGDDRTSELVLIPLNDFKKIFKLRYNSTGRVPS
jgi:hypothetical protein